MSGHVQDVIAKQRHNAREKFGSVTGLKGPSHVGDHDDQRGDGFDGIDGCNPDDGFRDAQNASPNEHSNNHGKRQQNDDNKGSDDSCANHGDYEKQYNTYLKLGSSGGVSHQMRRNNPGLSIPIPRYPRPPPPQISRGVRGSPMTQLSNRKEDFKQLKLDIETKLQLFPIISALRSETLRHKDADNTELKCLLTKVDAVLDYAESSNASQEIRQRCQYYGGVTRFLLGMQEGDGACMNEFREVAKYADVTPGYKEQHWAMEFVEKEREVRRQRRHRESGPGGSSAAESHSPSVWTWLKGTIPTPSPLKAKASALPAAPKTLGAARWQEAFEPGWLISPFDRSSAAIVGAVRTATNPRPSNRDAGTNEVAKAENDASFEDFGSLFNKSSQSPRPTTRDTNRSFMSHTSATSTFSFPRGEVIPDFESEHSSRPTTSSSNSTTSASGTSSKSERDQVQSPDFVRDSGANGGGLTSSHSQFTLSPFSSPSKSQKTQIPRSLSYASGGRSASICKTYGRDDGSPGSSPSRTQEISSPTSALDSSSPKTSPSAAAIARRRTYIPSPSTDYSSALSPGLTYHDGFTGFSGPLTASTIQEEGDCDLPPWPMPTRPEPAVAGTAGQPIFTAPPPMGRRTSSVTLLAPQRSKSVVVTPYANRSSEGLSPNYASALSPTMDIGGEDLKSGFAQFAPLPETPISPTAPSTPVTPRHHQRSKSIAFTPSPTSVSSIANTSSTPSSLPRSTSPSDLYARRHSKRASIWPSLTGSARRRDKEVNHLALAEEGQSPGHKPEGFAKHGGAESVKMRRTTSAEMKKSKEEMLEEGLGETERRRTLV